MALQDCIKKFKAKGQISDDQVKALELALANGMTDEQAVRTVQLQAHQNIVDIANRARNEGATLAPMSSPVSDVAEFQSRALQKIGDKRVALDKEVLELNEEFNDIASVVGHFRERGRRRVQEIRPTASDSAINDVRDDRVLMDLMMQLTLAKNRDAFEGLGLKGKDQFELFDAFRAMEARKDEITDRYVEIDAERSRLDKQSNAIFSGSPNTFYQSGPRLMVRHNISSEKLIFSDKLGGLAVPSMAVTKEGAEMSGFGEITLIGTDELGDPTKLPLFDADGYTVRFPNPEYKPASATDRDALWRGVLPYVMQWEDQSPLGWQLDQFLRDHPNPQVTIWHMLESNAVKAWYLQEMFGADLKPKMSDVKPGYEWGWDNDVVEFFSDTTDLLKYDWEDPRRQAILKRAAVVVEKAARRSAAKRLGVKLNDKRVDTFWELAGMLNRDGTLSETKFHQLALDATRKGTKEIDFLATTSLLDQRIAEMSMIGGMIGTAIGREGAGAFDYKVWVENKVTSIMGEPRLKIGGKWFPYILENIVRKMKGKLKGTEFENTQMTEGLMRAMAAHRFKKLEEMRQRAELMMDDRDVVDVLRVEAQEKMNVFLGQAAQFYVHANAMGYVDSFEAGDDARRAIIRWATRPGLPTVNDLEEELVRAGFEGIPEWMLDEGMDAAMTWMAVPSPYFEGKPQRAVMFDEFAGAVIPSDTSPEIRALLAKRRIPYKVYQVGNNIDETQTRTDAVTEFTQQLDNQGERTLFQSEIGFTSGLLTAAQTMPQEKGTAQQMLATLKKQPNVKKQELEYLGIDEWMETKEKVTRDELVAFIEAGGVQLKETQYGGKVAPPVVLQFSINENMTEEQRTSPSDEVEEFVWDVDDANSGITFTVYEDRNAGNVSVLVDNEVYLDDDGKISNRTKWLDMEGYAGLNEQSLEDARDAMTNYVEQWHKDPRYAGTAKWDNYTLPGGTNDREVVLHLPEVGGYNFTMDDLEESHHPALGDPAMSTERKAEVDREVGLYWYVDAFGPLSEQIDGTSQHRRVQTFQIPKEPFDTLEKAKQYIIDEKPMDPPSGLNYNSHAYSQANIMAWIRLTDHFGENGERVLMVEEVQSDLHQEGQKEGYTLTDRSPEVIAANAEILDANEFEIAKYEFANPVITRILDLVYTDDSPRDPNDIRDPRVGRLPAAGRIQSPQKMRELLETEIVDQSDWLRNWERDWTWQMRIREEAGTLGDIDTDFNANFTSEELKDVDDWAVARRETKEALSELGSLKATRRIPDMPFKGNAWAELAMKRVIRMAAEEGYDQIAWTTGEQQNDRWSLEEYYSRIDWDPRNDQLVAYADDGSIVSQNTVSMAGLDAWVGAERVLEIKKQMDEAERGFEIHTAAEMDVTERDVNMHERDILKDGYVLVDVNGELYRLNGGSVALFDSEESAQSGLEDVAYEGNIPTITGTDLTAEGSGMVTFYDKVLSNVTSKAAKRLDKSAKVKRFGVEIITGASEFDSSNLQSWKDKANDHWKLMEEAQERGATDQAETQKRSFDLAIEEVKRISASFSDTSTVHGMDVTADMMAMALEGQTLFQDRNRASITFDDTNKAVIRLSQSKDLSSFLHETGHLYLELMGNLAEAPDATEQIIDDYAKMLTYLGVNSRQEITRKHHELLARSFEAYLREGNAPTAELQPLFTSIKGWMLRVYTQISRLLGPNEALDDEIRGVFDRMVATDQQIAASEDYMGYVALYANAEEMGVSQRVFDAYRSLMDQSHDEAVDDETKKMIKALEWGQQQWFKQELEKVKAEVLAEAQSMPVYLALFALQKGTHPDGTKTQGVVKLSRDDLIRRYGKDFIKRLPQPWVYSVKGGTDADIVANMFGFGSGNELIQAMIKAPKIKDFVEAEAKRRMEDLHPNPMNSPEQVDEATRAVHNEKRGRILAAELRAIRKQMAADAKIVAATKRDLKDADRDAREANKGQLPKREDLALIKAAAKKVVEAKRIRDLNPNTYLQAERKAGRLAFEAMGRKDYETAYAEKRKQIMNYEAYRAAVRAKAQAARDQKYLKGFDKKAKRTRMGKAGVLEQIDAILDGIDFRKISGAQIDRENLNAEMLDAMKQGIADGTLVVPPNVLRTLETRGGTNWQDLTVEEFAGIRDVIKQLEHKAKTDLEIIINGEKVIIQEAVDDVAGSIIANGDKVVIPRGERRAGAKAKKSIKEGIGHWLRTSSIARILDNSGFGAVTRRIIVPIRRAYVEKLVPRLQKASEDVAEIYQAHYNNDELGALAKPIEDLTGEKLSKADILALGLNWGSESNRAAVLGGMMEDEFGNKTPAFTDQDVQMLLARLDARDWAFIQDVWDYQDSHYAEMAETERRRRGISPEKVEAMSFTITTSDGQEIVVRGGYHPLQYNPEHGGQVSEKEFEDYFNRVTNGTYVSANTRAGATYERVKNHGKVVLLSLNTIDRNLREVLRDITIGDEINLVRRILTSEEVTRAASNMGSSELVKELGLWLSDAAVGELPAQSAWEKGLSWVRVGFTKSKLAFNIYVTALQLTGVFQSMAVIGSGNYARGVGKFISNPAGNYKMVMERSKFMEARYGILQTWDKDVQDTNNFLKSMFGPVPTKFKTGFDTMGHYYFYPIAKMQSVVDVTTWMGAYEKGLNEKGLNEDDAVLYADTQVEASQTSGLFTDRSGIERGTLGSRTRQSQFVRLWTTLISYMLAKGNIAYEKGVGFKKAPTMMGAVQLATDYLLLFMIEGIASSILYDQWPGDEDEDETVAGWIAKVTAESVASGIPLVREFSGSKYGSGNTPVGALFNDLYKFNYQVQQGDADEAAIKAGVKVVGTLFHLPASQVNRFVEAAMSEDDVALYEYITGKRDK